MKEEIQEGMSSLKKGIIGLAGTMVAAVGTYVTTQFNSLLGIEEESDAPTEIVAPVENNNTQQQNVNVSGPEIIINIPEQKAAPATKTIIRETVKEVPAAPVEVVEEKPETPLERMQRLKREAAERNK
jgi:actin-like ATPase involved in cell morphogenesis